MINAKIILKFSDWSIGIKQVKVIQCKEKPVPKVFKNPHVNNIGKCWLKNLMINSINNI